MHERRSLLRLLPSQLATRHDSTHMSFFLAFKGFVRISTTGSVAYQVGGSSSPARGVFRVLSTGSRKRGFYSSRSRISPIFCCVPWLGAPRSSSHNREVPHSTFTAPIERHPSRHRHRMRCPDRLPFFFSQVPPGRFRVYTMQCGCGDVFFLIFSSAL